VEDLARQEQSAFLETLRELVSIDSGSRDLEGLERISQVIATRLRALGGDVQLVEPGDGARFEDTPERIGRMVLARFEGTGTARILLLAHMDTVYERGTAARQPFRLEGDRVYGAGIADDKHGIALILHALSMLRALDFREYGKLTILINADEEISSPGSRGLIARLGREHDVVFSCESGGAEGDDRLQLATAGIGDILLTITGRAAHAGVAPEEGRNAFYELAHQVLQLRDLSDPSTGRKVNWTLASAGTVRNAIPARARAVADVRVRRESDWDALEAAVRRRIAQQLVPGTDVEVVFERRRPPLAPTDGSRRLAARAQQIYAELGLTLSVIDEGTGGGTDAAIAAIDSGAAVLEGFGLRGQGMHSDDEEFVVVGSIVPRLFLLTRMIVDVSR
jgi:glutamate carboxypeptidase